ncbi:MAG: GLPGLI family protein [Gelidibacter sp.]|nr:GLPGLI family protein [Gelidibacter sp.]
MKRLVLLIILFFYLVNCISQNKDIYGAVYYKYRPNENGVLNSNKTKYDVKDLVKGLNEYTADVIFKMEFFNKTSIFTVGDAMDNDINLKGSSIANKLVSKGSYYCDLVKDIQLRKVGGEEFLIKTQPSKIKWMLTQETKNINNFKCYKAITKVTNKNFSGEHTFEIIAWYTLEIPIPFGPKQFNSLPGLILELKDTHNTFYAEKIELYPKEKIIIKPFKGDIISEEKYNEKIEENLRGFLKK